MTTLVSQAMAAGNRKEVLTLTGPAR